MMFLSTALFSAPLAVKAPTMAKSSETTASPAISPTPADSFQYRSGSILAETEAKQIEIALFRLKRAITDHSEQGGAIAFERFLHSKGLEEALIRKISTERRIIPEVMAIVEKLGLNSFTKWRHGFKTAFKDKISDSNVNRIPASIRLITQPVHRYFLQHAQGKKMMYNKQ